MLITKQSRPVPFVGQALHIQPNDKAIVYNVAMIQQKSAEMLFAIAPSKRSLQDLERVIAQAAHAQKLALLYPFVATNSYFAGSLHPWHLTDHQFHTVVILLIRGESMATPCYAKGMNI